MGRFVGGAGDVVDMAGRARTAAMLDSLFGAGTPSIDRDPNADRIAADEQALKLENLQPIGTEQHIKFGSPGQDLMSYEDDQGAAPFGTVRIGEERAARAARAGVGGKGGFKPSDIRAEQQDKMRAFYTARLDQAQKQLQDEVKRGLRTQDEADRLVAKAEREAALRINALGGESMSGFFKADTP